MSNSVLNEFVNYYYKQIVSPIERSGCINPKINADQPVAEMPDAYAGRIEGELDFYDGSSLEFSEFIELEKRLDNGRSVIEFNKNTYKYNYLGQAKNLIFRYDNKRESRYKHLKTYPHHKHTGEKKEDYAEGNPNVTLEDVINEINDIIYNDD